MSFFSKLETIGADIIKGIELAGPLVAGFIPEIGPILTDVATVIAALEGAGSAISPAGVSAVTQAIATASTVSQNTAAAAPKVTP